MIELASTTFSPPTVAEARSFGVVGRSDRTFAGLVRAVVRTRYLRAAGFALDPDAELGLRVAEEGACLALAARPALDNRELRTKQAVLQPVCSAPGHVAAMVLASLEADGRRMSTPLDDALRSAILPKRERSSSSPIPGRHRPTGCAQPSSARRDTPAILSA